MVGSECLIDAQADEASPFSIERAIARAVDRSTLEDALITTRSGAHFPLGMVYDRHGRRISHVRSTKRRSHQLAERGCTTALERLRRH